MPNSKAQVEFIAVVIFLVLIVVVAYTSLAGPRTDVNLPDAVKRKMLAVEDYFNGMAGKVTGDFIRDLEARGGYGSDGGTVAFLSNQVSVWQRCERSFIPSLEDIEKQLADNIQEYIKTNGPVGAEVFGEQTSFDFSELKTEAKIKETEVLVSIYVPTTVGQHIRKEPYNLSYQSDIGMIYNFASDFSASQGQKRHLENFLLATIYLSQEYEGSPLLPTFDVFSSNQTIYRSAGLLTEQLAKSINHSITNVAFWENMKDQSDSNVARAFAIKSVQGRQYPSLTPADRPGGIEFILPDGFAINITQDFQSVCDGKFIETVNCTKFSRDQCLTSYNVDYNITYPVVVRVFDHFTGSYFNFAVFAAIDNDMKPGGC